MFRLLHVIEKEIKSNRHSAHLVVFLLSRAREKEENHHSFLHPYLFVRSFAKKNALLSPAVCVCIRGHVRMSDGRQMGQRRQQQKCATTVCCSSDVLYHSQEQHSYIWIDYNANNEQYPSKPIVLSKKKSILLFFVNLETCSKINCTNSSTNCSTTINKCIY